MPFGQRAAITLLHDLIHKEVEVDDMIMKSKDHEGYILALRMFFERIQFYKLQLNPKRCTFGVTSEKLLRFMVSQRGIKVDPNTIKAIVEMKPPRTKKEIQGYLGRIQCISKFIAHLTMTCEPLFRLLKKEVPQYETNNVKKLLRRLRII